MLNTSSSHFLYLALSITKTKGRHINPKKMYHYYSTDIAFIQDQRIYNAYNMYLRSFEENKN